MTGDNSPNLVSYVIQSLLLVSVLVLVYLTVVANLYSAEWYIKYPTFSLIFMLLGIFAVNLASLFSTDSSHSVQSPRFS